MDKLTKEIIKPFLSEIERKDMPQVAEKDIEEMVAILEDNDIGYKAGPVTISRLHPTQEDFQPDKVKEMVDNLKSNKMVLFPIVVSEDGYILDGHHRWLAAKELYGENSQIPAIIIDLPKDEALLMFTKTSDKIDESITENPDTIYDKKGSELAAHAQGTAIAFGYNYDGEMYVGGPNVWHMGIRDWYDEFDHDTARHVPEDRGEMEYSGRFWVEDKLISFWEYPDKEAMPRVLKDIQDELQRIHDEFPDYAVESGLPLVDFDEDGWKIDLYTSEDRAEFDQETDKTFTGDEKPSDEKPKTDASDEKPPQQAYKQGSLDLTKNIVNRDTSDRIAGRPGRDEFGVPYDSETDDYDDDYEEEEEYDDDPEDITTGAQIPIKDYTGQTDKEKAATAAQAQAIQHVLSPLDKQKKDVPTGLGSRKRKAGMSATQYHQYVCTSEGKTLANFLVDSLLTETPDTVYDKDGVVIADHTADGVPFGYYEGKMYIGAINDHHPEIAGVYKKIDDKRKWDLQKEWPTSRRHYKFSGRFWAKEKLISFWDYPEASEIDKIFRDIEEEIPRFKNLFEKYIETSDEGEARLFLKWHDVPAEAVKFDNDWKIDTAEGVTDIESDRESLDAYGHQISVGEYKKDYEDSETPAQWSPEKMALQHVVSPVDKAKKEVPPGLGSRKKKGSMTPTQYQQYVCTSEGKNLADFLVKNLLTENPDVVYDKNGFEILHHSEGGVPFGYYKGKMYVGNIDTHHGEMPNKYPDLPSDPDALLPSATSKLLGWEETGAKEIWGRMWPEEKIISFWKYPEQNELKNVLKDIANETPEVKFDNLWNIDVSKKTPGGGLSTRGEQIPFHDYRGSDIFFKPDEVTSLKKSAQKFKNAEDFINSRFENEVFYINKVEIFKNPINSDYRIIKDDFRKKFPEAPSDYPSVRQLRDSNGNNYIWRADDAMHSQIEPGIQKKFNVKTNQSTFPGDRFSKSTHEKELRKIFDKRMERDPEKKDFSSPGEPTEKEKTIPSKRKMSNSEYHQYVCTSEGISENLNEDTDTSVIKKKINNVEFEFKYNEHVIEPYFTVSRDGVIVDRMPATLSKAEMKAFFQQNYSKWQADYVKSFGSRFTQIPQQGSTQGIYAEKKENLIDISVFLD